jgi:hypothetical protein
VIRTTEEAADAGQRFRCPTCRYDLTENVRALSDRIEGGVRGDTEIMCSECGATTTGLAASTVGGENRGWGYFLLWLAAVTMFLLLVGCGFSVVLYLIVAGRGGP